MSPCRNRSKSDRCVRGCWERACVVAVGLLAVQFVQAPQLLARLQMYDFVEYWAAGRLIASGENPYDLDHMHELERAAGRTEDGILMWNPPWTLPLVLPFGLLPVRVAHLLWLVLQLGVLVFCVDRLWLLYGGDGDRRWVAWLLGIAFLPTLFALTAGQITPLLLLGVVGFPHVHGAEARNAGRRRGGVDRGQAASGLSVLARPLAVVDPRTALANLGGRDRRRAGADRDSAVVGASTSCSNTGTPSRRSRRHSIARRR